MGYDSVRLGFFGAEKLTSISFMTFSNDQPSIGKMAEILKKYGKH